MKKIIVILILLFPINSYAQQYVREDRIDGRISVIQNNTILKTVSGDIFQVTNSHQKHFSLYSPKVFIFKDGSKYILKIDGIKEQITSDLLNKTRGTQNTKALITTKIDGDFKGYHKGNLYKLRNGQIWEQVDSENRSRNQYAPDVIIYLKSGKYYMQVEGMQDAVVVNKLK